MKCFIELGLLNPHLVAATEKHYEVALAELRNKIAELTEAISKQQPKHNFSGNSGSIKVAPKN